MLAARKYGNRRAKLRYDWLAEPLLPRTRPDEASDIAVTYKDIPVPNPHLVRVIISNVGPRDIASTGFDQNKPLRIHADGKFYGVLSSSHRETLFPAIGGDFNVELQPTLLKRGDSWEVSVLVSGNLAPSLDSPLIDTDVVDAATFDEQVEAASNLWIGLSRSFFPIGAALADVTTEVVRIMGIPSRRKRN